MRRAVPLAALLAGSFTIFGCGSDEETRACACELPGHGAQVCDGEDCGPCMCLPAANGGWDPWFFAQFYVAPGHDGTGTATDPWGEVDWGAVDTALGQGDVIVRFSTVADDRVSQESYADPLVVRRDNDGPSRLVLDGRSGFFADGDWEPEDSRRAALPGVRADEALPRHRTTVRGFEITHGSGDGVAWGAGDEVVLQDLVIHDVGGAGILARAPAEDAAPSTGFTVRNTHVFDVGEACVTVRGAGGSGQVVRTGLVLESNLLHHCGRSRPRRADGIDLSDGIEGASIRRSAIFAVRTGIETASPAVFEDELIFDAGEHGLRFTDAWGTSATGLTVRGGAVLRSGEDGIRIEAESQPADDLLLEYLLVGDSARAGVFFAAEAGASARIQSLVLAGNAVGMDGWGELTLIRSSCAVWDNGDDDDRVADGLLDGCSTEDPGLGDLTEPAGPDGLFFSADDPWRTR